MVASIAADEVSEATDAEVSVVRGLQGPATAPEMARAAMAMKERIVSVGVNQINNE